jgi:hypothetical protein
MPQGFFLALDEKFQSIVVGFHSPGMGRAFSPRSGVMREVLGRCPRLVWIGPLALRSLDAVRAVSPSGCSRSASRRRWVVAL